MVGSVILSETRRGDRTSHLNWSPVIGRLREEKSTDHEQQIQQLSPVCRNKSTNKAERDQGEGPLQPSLPLHCSTGCKRRKWFLPDCTWIHLVCLSGLRVTLWSFFLLLSTPSAFNALGIVCPGDALPVPHACWEDEDSTLQVLLYISGAFCLSSWKTLLSFVLCIHYNDALKKNIFIEISSITVEGLV